MVLVGLSPFSKFTLILLVIFSVPSFFEKRLKLPGLIGLLIAGFVLSDGLQIYQSDSEATALFSDIGKIFLMFMAGLEIDLIEFRKTKERSLGFGIATFSIPLLIGIVVGRLFGYGWNSSVLIGSLFASHTLLGYPIAQRLGIVSREAVTVTVGATIFTDIASLFVLAICLSIHTGGFSLTSLLLQLMLLMIYTAAVLVGVNWLGRKYFHHQDDEESSQFQFVLMMIFLAAVGAKLINLDKIIGAFLVGLAINNVIKETSVKEKLEFIGNSLFVPIFFVTMGFRLKFSVFLITIQSHFFLMLSIVGGLIVAKFLAAWIAKGLYRYSNPEAMLMWSLSLPQVAATLAAALIAFQTTNTQGERLIGEPVFDSVIVLMLVTSILGPILTERYGKKLSLSNDLVPLSDLKSEP